MSGPKVALVSDGTPTFARSQSLLTRSATVLLLATACTKTAAVPPAATVTRDKNLALGNLSGAVVSAPYPTNYLLLKPQYTLSYNRDSGKPN